MNNTLHKVLNFHDTLVESRFDKDCFGESDHLPEDTDLVRVTSNGEISYDFSQKEYVIFEESYAYEVGRTPYPRVAVAMMETYVEEYLG